MTNNSDYRFSFGPWTIHEGSDPFGPTVRPTVESASKLKTCKEAGFDAMMLHDDDAVPGLDSMSASAVLAEAKQYKTMLADNGLSVEMVAPRLWEDARGVDGGFTSRDPKVRQWAIDRSRQCVDICRAMETDLFVLWLAREGTYMREAKNPMDSHRYLIDAFNTILEHDPQIRIAIEPKPNEPMDHAYLPTIGHVLAIAHQTVDPARVGGLIEIAHSLLAGLDPADDLAFALQANKLWSVHLNDQNGLKYDQDKTFGSSNLRSAFNQVRVLEKAGFASTGMLAVDVKAMRTQKAEFATQHLINSKRMFMHLVEKVRSLDPELERQLTVSGNDEAVEMAILEHLMGV